ncbi:vacuolar protein sorting-associated protein 26B-like [Anopheles aquasalis]|uniref:vacuolar protein sorting-associated protein 26B-like n=1 Tax=Anopheles aquasalis TaxID=42839 RepID=UPI00215B1457|nr:vacuolar protein sorting-associated protein 26B-like [Anopheles aquasalis]
MNFLRFGQSADIDIIFDGTDQRQQAEIKTEDGKKDKYLLYYDGETVGGKVNITLKKPGSKLEHQGIKIELIGQIELYYDRGNHHDFLSLVRELARPGDLIQNTSYPFEFANVEKPYEVYVGSNVRLRYFLRVTIVRRLSDIVREVDIAVHTLSSYPDTNTPIKMEVGIEDCLHIEFEYNKSKYHLKDVIVGKIYFLLVRIKIKHMEIAIIKREQTGSGPNMYTENEIIAKYEIMDGSPVKGESIPIRVFLAGYDLTVTMREINKKFSVRYFLNLVLIDTEDRRYFKQQEITLWRKAEKTRKSLTPSQAAAIAAAQGPMAGGGGQLAITASSTNPHIPHHLVGQGVSSLGSKDLSGTVPAASSGFGGEGSGDGETKRSDDSNPIMGLFTEDNSQADLRPKPTPRQQLGGSDEMLDAADSEQDSLRAAAISSTNNSSSLKPGELPLHVDPDEEDDTLPPSRAPATTSSQQQQQQQQQHREAGDGAASISQTTDEETSSLFDANDLSFNAAQTTTASSTTNAPAMPSAVAGSGVTSSPTVSSSIKPNEEEELSHSVSAPVPEEDAIVARSRADADTNEGDKTVEASAAGAITSTTSASPRPTRSSPAAANKPAPTPLAE